MLLEVNKDILIEITKPERFNWNYVIAASEDSIVKQQTGSQIANEPLEGEGRPRFNSMISVDDTKDDLISTEVFDTENPITTENIEEQEERERKAERKRMCKKRCCSCF